jgi:hypothetical protein
MSVEFDLWVSKIMVASSKHLQSHNLNMILAECSSMVIFSMQNENLKQIKQAKYIV